MEPYDKWVSTYPIKPPVGGVYAWGAKANVKKTGTGRIDDIISLSEHLGRTEQEASAKAEAEAVSWIAAKIGK